MVFATYQGMKVKGTSCAGTSHNNLYWSVNMAWRDTEAYKTIKIQNCLLNIMDLTIQDQGGNNLVYINQGMTGVPKENVKNDSSGDESNEEQ